HDGLDVHPARRGVPASRRRRVRPPERRPRPGRVGCGRKRYRRHGRVRAERSHAALPPGQLERQPLRTGHAAAARRRGGPEGGGPDEDREGWFERGGWMMGYDEQFDTHNEGEGVVREWESKTEALLLGRKTCDIWAKAWGVWDENAEGFGGELTRRYNRVPKY